MTVKEKSRQWVIWISIVVMVGTIIGAFVLAFMGKGQDVNAISGLVGTTSASLAALGIGNYATKATQ